MKYWIIGLMIIAIVGAAYWAGTKKNGPSDSDTTNTPISTISNTSSPVSTVSYTPIPSQSPTTSSTGNVTIGNKPGNRAPDFRLKDANGRDVSLRDYLYRESVKLIFTKAGELVFQPDSMPRGITLIDPGDVIHRLYGVTSMPYTVSIDANGIIR